MLSFVADSGRCDTLLFMTSMTDVEAKGLAAVQLSIHKSEDPHIAKWKKERQDVMHTIARCHTNRLAWEHLWAGYLDDHDW
jgi:hypothetical protein